MLTADIKIGNVTIGKAFIETDMGKHESIEIWIPNVLVMAGLDSTCNNITVIN